MDVTQLCDNPFWVLSDEKKNCFPGVWFFPENPSNRKSNMYIKRYIEKQEQIYLSVKDIDFPGVMQYFFGFPRQKRMVLR